MAKTILPTLDLYGPHNYENGDIESINIKGPDYKAEFASFKTVTFKKLVCFDNVQMSVGLIFDTCIFEDEINFINVSTRDINVKLNPDFHSLVFKNCVFQKPMQFLGIDSSIERTVVFDKCTFDEGLNVEYLFIEREGLKISNCTINKKLDLFNVSTKQDITFTDNEINCDVRFEKANSSNLNILKGNIYHKKFFIKSCQFTQGIIFNDGIFKGEVYFTLINTGKVGLQIFGSLFEKIFHITYHLGDVKPQRGIYSFNLNDANFLNSFFVGGKNSFSDSAPIVELISIAFSPGLKGELVFRDLNVGILGLKGFNNSANLIFQDLFINQIKIDGLINNSGIVFSGIKGSFRKWYREQNAKIIRENELFINDSNLGKAQFLAFDFGSFHTIVLHNSILTDISTSLVKWFLPNQLNTVDEPFSKNVYKSSLKFKDQEKIKNNLRALLSNYQSKQEIYRQLKFASQRQGDIPQALEFQRHEMNNYRQIIKYKKPRRWNEFLILWSNQTNNFGQSWLKALILLILCSLIVYVPIGFLTSENLDYSKFSSSDIGLNFKVVFWENFHKWPIILNPAHRISDLKDGMSHYSNWIYFWDLLSRVVVSYFIFQTISAFRKFNK